MPQPVAFALEQWVCEIPFSPLRPSFFPLPRHLKNLPLSLLCILRQSNCTQSAASQKAGIVCSLRVWCMHLKVDFRLPSWKQQKRKNFTNHAHTGAPEGNFGQQRTPSETLDIVYPSPKALCQFTGFITSITTSYQEKPRRKKSQQLR